MSETNKPNVGRLAAKGSILATSSNLAARGIAFLTTIVMARLLEPADFGVVAIGLICIGLLDAFRNFGVGEALIYRQRPGDNDSNTAFWIALVVGSLLTLFAFLLAPAAGVFFNNPTAGDVIAVLSIVFIIEAFTVIHATRAQRDFQFGRRAVAEITKAVFKAGCSIGLALAGFGLWSLVIGQIVGAVAGAICFWLIMDWRPRFNFDNEAAVGLVSYGSMLICLGFIAFGINRSDQFVIGRHLDATMLGYYAVAFNMVDLLVANPARTIGQASYAAFSRLADDTESLRQNYLDTLLFVSLLSVALGAGLFAISSELVLVFLTEKWTPAIAVIKVLTCFAVVHAVAYSAGDVLKAIGKARWLVLLSLLWLLVALPVLWLVAPSGIVNVAWSVFAFQLVAGVAVMLLTKSVIQIAGADLLRQLAPAICAGLAMLLVLMVLLPFVVAALGVTAHDHPAAILVSKILLGAFVYIATVTWIRPDVATRVIAFIGQRSVKLADGDR